MTPTKKYSTFYLTVPPGTDMDQVVSLFNLNGMLVDDLCSASTAGRELVVWVPSESLNGQDVADHVGFFWGKQPNKELQDQYEKIYTRK
jgi:hypothetical protein